MRMCQLAISQYMELLWMISTRTVKYMSVKIIFLPKSNGRVNGVKGFFGLEVYL